MSDSNSDVAMTHKTKRDLPCPAGYFGEPCRCFDDNTRYHENNIVEGEHNHQTSRAACRDSCRDNSDCFFWSWVKDSATWGPTKGQCFLKNARAQEKFVPSHKYVSGSKQCNLPEDTECAAFCPDGWKSQGYNCYKFFDERKSWVLADLHCTDFGGHLVSVHSPEENKFVADLMLGSNDVWMGGADLIKEGEWKWSDGTPFGYTNWWYNGPNNDGEEDCVSLMMGKTWNDQPCDRKNKFICKIMFAEISLPKNCIRQ